MADSWFNVQTYETRFIGDTNCRGKLDTMNWMLAAPSLHFRDILPVHLPTLGSPLFSSFLDRLSHCPKTPPRFGDKPGFQSKFSHRGCVPRMQAPASRKMARFCCLVRVAHTEDLPGARYPHARVAGL
jgi:hypothetical protein